MKWDIPSHCPLYIEDFARMIGRKIRHKTRVRIDPRFDTKFPPHCISAIAWDVVVPEWKGAHRPMHIWGPEPESVDFVLRLNTSPSRCAMWQKVVLMHELGHAIDGHKSGVAHQLHVSRAWQYIRENANENAGSVPLHFRQTVFKNEWVAWDIAENWLDAVPEEINKLFYELKTQCLNEYAEVLQVNPRRPL